ncbi:hypothetical protein LH51_13280 [Nitrincola sp. A-D6]|uniref:hypothetical protein n=1 Tax=Nitrincola sp. A-D6 TaxID=1545442 RepID=UPI00051FB1E0|nr:hypothetical protein [Nitrincola sp. A-D6]KGK41655.1 hypothetical protein LH51_13280 [Nitrincola sp. A-D6]
MQTLTKTEHERVINDFNTLAKDTQQVLREFIEGAQVLEIVTAEAHGVTETSISYLRGDKVADVIYDETTGKLLGGSEPAVFEKVIAVLPESGRQAVAEKTKAPAKIRKIKIKHDEKDDREYVHLHTIDPEGNINSFKMELDGSSKR